MGATLDFNPSMSIKKHLSTARKLLAAAASSEDVESIDQALAHARVARRLVLTAAEVADYAKTPESFHSKKEHVLWLVGQRRALAAQKRAEAVSLRLLLKRA